MSAAFGSLPFEPFECNVVASSPVARLTIAVIINHITGVSSSAHALEGQKTKFPIGLLLAAMASAVSGVPIKWNIEVPSFGSSDDSFGGCRGIEGTYRKIKQIGEGTYGQVYLAEEIATGDLVALKKIRMDSEREGFPITAIREIKLLSHLSHPNVIRLREIVRSQVHAVNQMKGSIYMVCDYMDHDLTGLMERRNYKFTIPQIKCYMKQLLSGLTYCHSCKVLHRDLKASNLLINNEGQLKLADFGLARPFKEASQGGKLTNRVITLWYRPPELILGSENYGPEVDIWSCGCILAELILGKPLFPGKDEADQMDKISQVLGSPNEVNMPGFSKLEHSKLMNQQTYKKNNLRQFMKQHAGEKVKEMGEKGMLLLERMLAMNPSQRIKSQDACLEKNGWFFTEPLPCEKDQLPTFEASHEMDMKAKRHAARQAQHQQQQSGGRGGGGNRHHSSGQPDAKRARYDSRGAAGAAGAPTKQQQQQQQQKQQRGPAIPSQLIQPLPPLPLPRVLPMPMGSGSGASSRAGAAAAPQSSAAAGNASYDRLAGNYGAYQQPAGRDYGGTRGSYPGAAAGLPTNGSREDGGYMAGGYNVSGGYRQGQGQYTGTGASGQGTYNIYSSHQGGYGGGAGVGAPVQPGGRTGQLLGQGLPRPPQQGLPRPGAPVLGQPPPSMRHSTWERQKR